MIKEEGALRLALTARLSEIYGAAEGMRAAGVLVPAVVGDFAGMLERAEIGDPVSEEYRTEDGVARILLSAVKTAGGSAVQSEVKPVGETERREG